MKHSEHSDPNQLAYNRRSHIGGSIRPDLVAFTTTVLVATVVAIAWLGSASAQANPAGYVVKKFDPYTVRCSSIDASVLSEEVVRRYGITEVTDVTGILSCVLQEQADDGMWVNAEGSFSGVMQTLIARQELEFRSVLENRAPTYIATFERTSDSPVRFFLVAQTQSGKSYEVIFQDPPA